MGVGSGWWGCWPAASQPTAQRLRPRAAGYTDVLRLDGGGGGGRPPEPGGGEAAGGRVRWSGRRASAPRAIHGRPTDRSMEGGVSRGGWLAVGGGTAEKNHGRGDPSGGPVDTAAYRAGGGVGAGGGEQTDLRGEIPGRPAKRRGPPRVRGIWEPLGAMRVSKPRLPPSRALFQFELPRTGGFRRPPASDPPLAVSSREQKEPALGAAREIRRGARCAAVSSARPSRA